MLKPEPTLVEPLRGKRTAKASASAGNGRRRRRRSIRVARASIGDRERAEQRACELEQGVERPRTREECRGGPRPCPFVACKHHLYLDVSPTTGTIKLNFPNLEVWELTESCALDVAEAGALELDRTSLLLNVTRERVRQIEAMAMAKLAMLADARQLRDV